MYIKIIGCFLILGCCGGIGKLFAGELSERVKRLQELKRMVVNFKGELSFHHAALQEAFLRVSERVAPPYDQFLKNVSGELEKRDGRIFLEIWQEELESLIGYPGFRKSDKDLLLTLAEGIGYLDLKMQQETLELVLQQLEEMSETAAEERKRNGRFFEVLGVMAGAFLIILVI
ncbi:MAG: stage III sporulation protein AB [Lachnospiraceae bacterium]